MAASKEKFYVTTPIYYVTARPHLGSLYSTLIADVVARWQRLCGKDSFFLTGTDEHGQKVAQAAEAVGKDPKAFVDSFIPAYEQVWQQYELAYNYFVRTTDPGHKEGLQVFLQRLIESGAIYKDRYHGWYCTPCETFVTRVEHAGQAPPCPSCGRETALVQEETYFFRLSAYAQPLLDFYREHPDFIVPRERANEVIAFVEAGLTDLSISRTTVAWGVPFPDDPNHTVYVWVDALANYITAIGYGQEARQEQFEHLWPADLHVLGKDIVRFHAIYWPAFLMAAGLPLPKRLLVHGWIKVDKQKMSKSLGNVVDPVVLHDKYGVDQVRYYLMRQIAVNTDGEFSIADLEQRINSDLANDLGNLLQRMSTLARKNDLFEVRPPEAWSPAALSLRDAAWSTIEQFRQYMDECEFHLALAALWRFIHQVNAYFHEQEPWKISKADSVRFAEIISATCHSLRMIGILVAPIMPVKMAVLLGAIGTTCNTEGSCLEELELGVWQQTFRLMETEPLFRKIDKTEQEVTDSEKGKEDEQIAQKPSYVAFEDFVKVELVVGTIKECDPVPKSEKLLKLQVDCGAYGMRQVLSGIAHAYRPDQLIDTQAIFVLNLKPRKMMGLESQGMMLLAEDDAGSLVIATVADPVPNGMRLR